MEVKLSKRLLTIANRIPTGAILADIGSDHALLPVYAVQHGLVRHAIAGEINAGPLMAAQKQIKEAGLSEQVTARKGDGLDVISPGEVTLVTIAGMGGSTMVSILDRGCEKLKGVEMLILQPNVGEAAVRAWMIRNRWQLTDETILEEDGLFYEILTATPSSNPLAPYGPLSYGETVIDHELQLLMGPYLLRKKEDVLVAKWSEEIEKRERILKQMDQAQSGNATDKRKSLQEETDHIKEVLACLRTAKRSFN